MGSLQVYKFTDKESPPRLKIITLWGDLEDSPLTERGLLRTSDRQVHI